MKLPGIIVTVITKTVHPFMKWLFGVMVCGATEKVFQFGLQINT